MDNATMIERVTKLAAETAVTMAIEHIAKERQKQSTEKKDRRIRNTKLLLKHYRKFVAHTDGYVTKDDILNEGISTETFDDEMIVETIKKSKKKTYIMVNFINQMLEVYRITTEQTGKLEEIRKYKVIHAMYISEEIKDIKQIADCHKIENRTIYRDINEACNSLSVLMFGVDAIKLIK